MNSVQITGNLTKDPVVRATKTGRSVASMTVAVNTRYTVQGQEKEMTAWVPVTAWGSLAEEAGMMISSSATGSRKSWPESLPSHFVQENRKDSLPGAGKQDSPGGEETHPGTTPRTVPAGSQSWEEPQAVCRALPADRIEETSGSLGL